MGWDIMRKVMDALRGESRTQTLDVGQKGNFGHWSRESDGERYTADGERIIEGSTHQTYVVHDEALQKKMLRLWVLDVRIEYGESLDQDLVCDLNSALRSGDCKEPRLTQVNQYLAAATIDMICRKTDEEIAGRYFLLGPVDPSDLAKCRGMREYVNAILMGYPDADIIEKEFSSTAIVGKDFSGQESVGGRIDDHLQDRSTTIGSEKEPANRYDLMRTVTKDFSAIGELISYPRLCYVNPIVPELAMAPFDRRQTMLRQIIQHEYPFLAENKENWASIISEAQGIR